MSGDNNWDAVTAEMQSVRRQQLRRDVEEPRWPAYAKLAFTAFYVTAATVAQIANGALIVFLLQGA